MRRTARGTADDSEVARDRPIKCCDDFHSISHYPSADAAARENGPTGRFGAGKSSAESTGPCAMAPAHAPHADTATPDVQRSSDTSGYAGCRCSMCERRRNGRRDRECSIVGSLQPALHTAHGETERRAGPDGCKSAAVSIVRKAGKRSEEKCRPVGWASGARGQICKDHRPWPAKMVQPRLPDQRSRRVRAPSSAPGMSARRVHPSHRARRSHRTPTPSARRCAGRAPCRARGDQFQRR